MRRMRRAEDEVGGRAWERVPLWAVWLVTAVSVAGFATFGVHPSLVARLGGARAAEVYAAAFSVLPRAQVLAAFAAFAALLTLRVGRAWVPAAAALYLASLCSELAGTTWGVPFGEYGYRSALGWMWLGRVPAVIPLSWFYMAVPSYALVRRLLRRGGGAPGPAAEVLLGAALLTAWDLALDPAMSAATSYWWWGERGVYYGMPLLNLLGWFVTGVVLTGLLAAFRTERWLERVPTGALVSFWGANLALALGMCAAAGLWGAWLATALGLALVYGLTALPGRLRGAALAEGRA